MQNINRVNQCIYDSSHNLICTSCKDNNCQNFLFYYPLHILHTPLEIMLFSIGKCNLCSRPRKTHASGYHVPSPSEYICMPQSSSRFQNLSNKSNIYRIEESEIYDNSKGDIVG